ncbi:hypothetical protein ADU37_CDS17090 [Thermococcus sp. 2319x1]|uniref:DUF3226 domain-containing protein n=1 Tax=Thermococcus sp. 2319x1 TaxID=1674923 RepID=UPI00073A6852|nr:DUF3226 domain-containing protein [Thermococcus sp. 2319x1]ALV63408.1 hypothetical protein ADU37_CDS17090 [Thermococcus sp. 2319x1]
MIIVTGERYDEALKERDFEKILFPEYGKNREKLKEFVNNLRGNEVIVTASLELIDLILGKFQGEGHILIYSNTGKGLTFKEAYELRKYLDFDLRGAEITNTEKVSVLFCEGKTDSKFFKASYKKVFGFKEAREVPSNLALIEKLFERDNYELIRNNGYIAIIPSEGNAGVIRNLGNFLRAMEVFEFHVGKIGLAIDIDESKKAVMDSIKGKLSSFHHTETKKGFKVGKTEVIPLLIGSKVDLGPCVEWQKPTIEDFMLAILEGDKTFKKLERAINILYVDLKRKLKPKEVIYLAMAAKKFWGNLEGFYEMSIMRTPKCKVEKVLKESKIYEKMEALLPSL